MARKLSGQRLLTKCASCAASCSSETRRPRPRQGCEGCRMSTNSFQLQSTVLELSPRSLASHEGMEYGLGRIQDRWQLAVLSTGSPSAPDDFRGESSSVGGNRLLVCPLNAENAAALRARLTWLQPHPLGLQTSAGMGDRIGLATPGHVRALRAVGAGIAPIFAQQSIREMGRTVRTPQQVMDDATWGIFAEGWRAGVGADADHLKTTDDIEACLSAGFTFFTIDPGAHVDGRAESAGVGELRELSDSLPEDVRLQASGLQGRTFSIEGLSSITFDEPTLLKAAVKYGK